MNFTPEQIAKAKAAKSVEELLVLAKESGMELTEEEAAKYFAEWHKEGELSEDELNNVSGGCGDDDEPAKQTIVAHTIPIGTVVNYSSLSKLCPVCNAPMSGSTTFWCSVDEKFKITVRLSCIGRGEEYYVISNDNS